MFRYKYIIKGIVQGVGFRPFIYKLALRYNLYGFVFNNSIGVIVEIEGLNKNIELFDRALLD
ncbi:MAG: acylphosphatase, partial [Campylobacterota bacterium]|nr:acylphosphatase [Campylobacterota bacterium]